MNCELAYHVMAPALSQFGMCSARFIKCASPAVFTYKKVLYVDRDPCQCDQWVRRPVMRNVAQGFGKRSLPHFASLRKISKPCELIQYA